MEEKITDLLKEGKVHKIHDTGSRIQLYDAILTYMCLIKSQTRMINQSLTIYIHPFQPYKIKQLDKQKSCIHHVS